jgi:hypothetical protein
VQWLNAASFAIPALGAYGNLGRENVQGPGVFQLNVAVSRTFAIRERKTIQVRAEAFNLPNRVNFANPVNTVSTPTFGQITSDISGNNGLSNSGDPRIIQVAMKFVF